MTTTHAIAACAPIPLPFLPATPAHAMPDTTEGTPATIAPEQEQEPPPPPNLLAIEPLTIDWRIGVGYYRRLFDELTVGAQAYVIMLDRFGTLDGVQAGVEIRLHPDSGEFYLAPTLSYLWFINATYLLPGGVFGWQWYAWERAGFGLALGFEGEHILSGERAEPTVGFIPIVRFDVGYAF